MKQTNDSPEWKPTRTGGSRLVTADNITLLVYPAKHPDAGIELPEDARAPYFGWRIDFPSALGGGRIRHYEFGATIAHAQQLALEREHMPLPAAVDIRNALWGDK